VPGLQLATFITDFADQAVLLPIAALVGIVLVCQGWIRGAVIWTLVVGGALGTILILKIVLFACASHVLEGAMRSPSGHTGAAACIYGGLVALVGRWSTGTARLALLVAMCVALVIGGSRLALGAHTVIEVTLGALTGVISALALAKWAGPPPPKVQYLPLAFWIGLVALVFHGVHLPAEAAIRSNILVSIWPLSACSVEH
jgi:membrane-associated phospholipid phosphatase